MSIFAKAATFVRSPQGKRLMRKAATYAKSPEGRRQIQRAVETARSPATRQKVAAARRRLAARKPAPKRPARG